MEEIIVYASQAKYPVFIGSLQKIIHQGKVLIISNPKIAGLHLDRLLQNISADEVYISIIPDGECYKNFETLGQILETAFNSRLDRKSLMIALGGGVVSDITGFASAIYQRGIDFIAIPTTLLAQVDASVGGKTGINNHFGKNLVGVFHQPKAVHIDPFFLSTLPEREFRAGVAEIIKMAVCFERDFFLWLQNCDLSTPDSLQTAISKSVRIKAKVVSSDEKEQGVRAGLNYGHTFAHVIENETNYSLFLHGEAVAIGMLMANDLAVALGYLSFEESSEIAALLKKYGLDLDYKIQDIQMFYDKFFLDKKSCFQKIKFVLPAGIGNLIITENAPKEVVMRVLEKWSKK
ncbi:3-dehydroquinate synthase [Helicobacter sp. 12S02232-10]|uniref:3-dehydroquinate synthase n=1 Tax=Helicobacter sp. 12S02232-10 TaxID=1476197 RepID=UPI000BA5AC1D|nr:3-dehydroquinate synthase [Helicobacter sp. 12S02232-10]PAF48253.1 3-dehydroquinate synthase [Helicobacter sp. 12S02232-10]